MIVKFFKSNKNPINQAFNYLLNERVQEETSKLLSGDRDLAIWLANNTKNKIKYISGVISLAEDSNYLTEKQQFEIMTAFEEMLIPDEKLRQQLHFTWIKHIDKERLELNFVMNTKFQDTEALNLKSETYQFYFMHHKEKIELFQDYVNAKYNLKSARLGKPSLEKNTFGRKMSKNELRDFVHQTIMTHKELHTRDQLIQFLSSDTQAQHIIKVVNNQIKKSSFSIISAHSSENTAHTRIKLKSDADLDRYRTLHLINQSEMKNILENAYFQLNSELSNIEHKLSIMKQKTQIFDHDKYYRESKTFFTKSENYRINQKVRECKYQFSRYKLFNKKKRFNQYDSRDYAMDTSTNHMRNAIRMESIIRNYSGTNRNLEHLTRRVQELGGNISKRRNRLSNFSEYYLVKLKEYNALINYHLNHKNQIKKEIHQLQYQNHRLQNQMKRNQVSTKQCLFHQENDMRIAKQIDEMSPEEYLDWLLLQMKKIMQQFEQDNQIIQVLHQLHNTYQQYYEHYQSNQKKLNELTLNYEQALLDFGEVKQSKVQFRQQYFSDAIQTKVHKFHSIKKINILSSK